MTRGGGVPPSLLRAYHGAEVHIAVKGKWVPWEAFPRPRGTRIHILTAHNPGSVPHSRQENQARHLRLAAALLRRGYTSLPARNRAPGGGWEEEAFAVVDAPRDAILELGRAFGQLAVYEIGEEGRDVVPCGEPEEDGLGKDRAPPSP